MEAQTGTIMSIFGIRHARGLLALAVRWIVTGLRLVTASIISLFAGAFLESPEPGITGLAIAWPLGTICLVFAVWLLGDTARSKLRNGYVGTVTYVGKLLRRSWEPQGPTSSAAVLLTAAVIAWFGVITSAVEESTIFVLGHVGVGLAASAGFLVRRRLLDLGSQAHPIGSWLAKVTEPLKSVTESTGIGDPITKFFRTRRVTSWRLYVLTFLLIEVLGMGYVTIFFVYFRQGSIYDWLILAAVAQPVFLGAAAVWPFSIFQVSRLERMFRTLEERCDATPRDEPTCNACGRPSDADQVREYEPGSFWHENCRRAHRRSGSNFTLAPAQQRARTRWRRFIDFNDDLQGDFGRYQGHAARLLVFSVTVATVFCLLAFLVYGDSQSNQGGASEQLLVSSPALRLLVILTVWGLLIFACTFLYLTLLAALRAILAVLWISSARNAFVFTIDESHPDKLGGFGAFERYATGMLILPLVFSLWTAWDAYRGTRWRSQSLVEIALQLSPYYVFEAGLLLVGVAGPLWFGHKILSQARRRKIREIENLQEQERRAGTGNKEKRAERREKLRVRMEQAVNVPNWPVRFGSIGALSGAIALLGGTIAQISVGAIAGPSSIPGLIVFTATLWMTAISATQIILQLARMRG